jgi:hypothetical protein
MWLTGDSNHILSTTFVGFCPEVVPRSWPCHPFKKFRPPRREFKQFFVNSKRFI